MIIGIQKLTVHFNGANEKSQHVSYVNRILPVLYVNNQTIPSFASSLLLL